MILPTSKIFEAEKSVISYRLIFTRQLYELFSFHFFDKTSEFRDIALEDPPNKLV